MLMLADADVVAAVNDFVAVVVGKAVDVLLLVWLYCLFFYTGSNGRSRGIDQAREVLLLLGSDAPFLI